MSDKKPMTQDIRESVKKGLDELGAKGFVRDKLVNQLVESETDKRVKAATAVFEKLEAAELERRKIKPQFNGYNAEGVGQGEPLFTKDQTEQLKKLNEQVEKLNKALENALFNNDFSKVFDLAK